MPPPPNPATPTEKNLLLWAEVTALAIELRKAFLAKDSDPEDIEHAVWAEFTGKKERAWTNNIS